MNNSGNYESRSTEQAVVGVTDQAWTMVGVGDFNGDGVSDILWRNTRTGANTIWKSGDRSTEQAVVRVDEQAYKVAGVGDFDGDGVSDILWRKDKTGQIGRAHV